MNGYIDPSALKECRNYITILNGRIAELERKLSEQKLAETSQFKSICWMHMRKGFGEEFLRPYDVEGRYHVYKYMNEYHPGHEEVIIPLYYKTDMKVFTDYA